MYVCIALVLRSKDDGSLHYWDRYVFANSLAGLIKPIFVIFEFVFGPFFVFNLDSFADFSNM